MHRTITSELYVHATPEAVARAVPARSVAGGVTFTAAGSWHAAAWTRSLDAWRQEGRWERGRAGGGATIDLLAADAGRTLVVITLTERRGSLGRRGFAAASALAAGVRAVAEGGEVAAVVPLAHRGPAATPAERPASLAVGYSSP